MRANGLQFSAAIDLVEPAYTASSDCITVERLHIKVWPVAGSLAHCQVGGSGEGADPGSAEFTCLDPQRCHGVTLGDGDVRDRDVKPALLEQHGISNTREAIVAEKCCFALVSGDAACLDCGLPLCPRQVNSPCDHLVAQPGVIERRIHVELGVVLYV